MAQLSVDDRSTGGLSLVATQSVGLDPRDLVVDPGGRFLFVVNEAGDDITRFSIASSGALQELGVTPAGDEPVSLALIRMLQ